MINIKLDARLQALADFVPAGSSAADIGADHGYLSIYLAEKRQAARVIAGEKNKGPYEAACHNVAVAGLSDKIAVRLGDGLEVLQPGEAEVICIAGMGGSLMAEILEQGLGVLTASMPDQELPNALSQEQLPAKQIRQLVLQPMNGADILRRWLYSHGWHIEQETLARADGRIYAIMSAALGEADMPSAVELLVGPIICHTKPLLYHEYLEGIIQQKQRIAEGMAKGRLAMCSDVYTDLLKYIKELEALK